MDPHELRMPSALAYIFIAVLLTIICLYDVDLLHLLLILYHLSLLLFDTCPTDFDYTLIQIKYHMHVDILTN